ncbi:succinylglutamate desuccinylase/aspartoacylase domain-containing protein [Flagellimonas allohymeniacidonis]|uniref:Aspartoacylase n=1 Tax=Flagellimonas allohymeniacidonis TaxID=2517819 RepID=A0A4Q8QA55_9FLAO|nr:succinylglutamate desuccinylase/aspartoacylase family protein [Allomuricauda hymeniacidonis]TAI47111.1 aspartoacylase [Allomuricauda hymeniacidonis]
MIIKESPITPNQTLTVNRIFGHVIGEQKGPTLVFFAGIHGNEPAGIFALESVLKGLGTDRKSISGELYAIAGNLPALKKGVRFIDEDLNRIWLPERFLSPSPLEPVDNIEQNEMMELLGLVEEIMATGSGPFYFIDLHTTSGDTSPFMLINDTLLNRRFASNYPLPVILGIEEYLQGTFFNYINQMGHVALGFEGGKHRGDLVVENTIKFIEFTLGLTGFKKVNQNEWAALKDEIQDSSLFSYRFYEVFHQHAISINDEFEMLKGYINFQKIEKGKPLAFKNGKMITAIAEGQIFMPLYQKKGQEGFYIIRKIPKLFLTLSKYLRKTRAEALLLLLPGISWASKTKDALSVNKKIARFFSKQLFHLLGYRIRNEKDNKFIVKKRERRTQQKLYSKEDWYKKQP